ncbi:MFS transporter [Solirubrobacter ginsenosidimutans]|uniref:MFS transporter n=1 Tax=Solirubrobacter ginsenosidimutans TaxID=490573 RepID=A0A9X3MR20_9ACTN|nr:MFS transporter [Solirubrobacter ginsenosidimutans]MDA0160316.1 MFS transporter [Solirubrobacter ginsenosidimutans]
MATRTTAAHVWAPLGDRRFRIGSAAFIGAQVVVWAETVGAVEVITSHSASAAAVAAIQTAITLPGMVLGLLAGAVADAFDRRRLLIFSAVGMTAAMALLAVLEASGHAGTATVLLLTAALGTGLAIQIPAFMTAVPEIVPRPLLTAANTFVSAGTNVARAVGPALAGLALLILGSAGLFGLLAIGLALVALGMATAGLRSVRPAEPERLVAAIMTGVRHVRGSPPLRAVMARSALFLLFGSALWAILPLIAVHRLGLEASGFGILLACVGTGAVLAALTLGTLHERAGLERVVSAAGLLLGAVLALLTLVTEPVITGVLLLLAGAAWIAVVPALNTLVALLAPPWVRGRALSVWFLGYNGGLAIGSLLWGLLAETSLAAALLVPAAGLAAGAFAGRVWPLTHDL